MRASREPVIVPRDRAERPEVLPHLMSGSKQDIETVHAFFQDMRACGLGDPIIVASVVRRVPSVNASRARADRALPSRLEHAPHPIRRRSASSRHAATKAATPAKRTLWLREITHDAFHLVSRRAGQT